MHNVVLKHGRKKHHHSVSCREYYAYKLHIRPNTKSILLHSGRLFQQYVVDMYIKLESIVITIKRTTFGNEDTMKVLSK